MKKNEAKDLLDRLNFEFEQMIAIKSDMDGVLNQTYINKVDTICRKLENVIYQLREDLNK